MTNEFDAYRTFLDEGDALTIAVLKGHLAIEAILSDIVSNLTDRGDLLGEAANTFHRKTLITQAHAGGHSNDPAWELLGKLNALRNRAAHDLDLDSSSPRIKKIGELLNAIDPEGYELISNPTDDLEIVTHVTSFLIGFLEAYRRESAA